MAKNNREMNNSQRSKSYNKKIKGQKNKLSHEKNAGQYQETVDKIREYRKEEGHNDPIWYMKYPDLIKSSASLPYPYRPGATLPLGTYEFTPSGGTLDTYPMDYIIPGVSNIYWIPSCGYSDSATSPISLVGQQLYARVRSNFSGGINLDAPDFVIYLMALDSIYTLISHAQRIYKIFYTYTPYNHITPGGLLKSLGFTQTANTQSSRLDYWGRINDLIRKVNQFVVPSRFDIFNRHIWMSKALYTDAPTVNAQIYQFVPKGYYQYTLNTGTTNPGGSLEYKQLDVVTGLNGLLNIIDTAINSLIKSDDVFDISGYLFKAFPESDRFIYPLMELEEPLELLYNEEVLTQIENIQFTRPDVNTLSILQDVKSNAIIYKPKPQSGLSILPSGVTYNLTLNSRSDVPLDISNVIASRLITTVINGYLHPATEMVYNIEYYSFNIHNADLAGPDYELNSTYIGIADTTQFSDLKTLLEGIALMSAFDWAPRFYVFYDDDTNFSTVDRKSVV